MRKEESSPTVMWALPISRPPLYSTASRIRFPESPVYGTKTQGSGLRPHAGRLEMALTAFRVHLSQPECSEKWPFNLNSE